MQELKKQVSSCDVNPSDKMNEILLNATPGIIAIIKLFFNMYWSNLTSIKPIVYPF